MLWRLLNKPKDDRKSVVIEICHSEPGAWKPASFMTSDCPQFSSSVSYHIGSRDRSSSEGLEEENESNG